MSEKREDLRDPLVSRTYRELAREETPGRLDRAVLANASQRAATPLAGRRRWVKPLAWAATITLSLALVLEMSRVPAPGDSAGPRDPAAPPAAPARNDSADADKAEAAPAAIRPASQPSAGRPGESQADRFRLQEATPVRQAEELMMLKSSEAGLANDAHEARRAAEPAAPRHCDETQTATRERWLDCIEALVAAGRPDAARAESRRLEATFPAPD